ncbi:MAG: hypothetical protein ACR2J5_10995 [Geodermatophilaceae bacterium]
MIHDRRWGKEHAQEGRRHTDHSHRSWQLRCSATPELHKRIIGQEEAIKAVSQAIRRTRAGLKDPRRPGGSFIFAGPRGEAKPIDVPEHLR